MTNSLEARLPLSYRELQAAENVGGFSLVDYEDFFRRNEATGQLAQVWSDVLFRLTSPDEYPSEVLGDQLPQM